MKYFSITELTRSDTAVRLNTDGITSNDVDNTPSPEVVQRLTLLVDKLLDPLREAWGRPLRVNSGYRSPELNAAIGGAKNSQHMSGEAADITTGSVAGNKMLFNFVKERGFVFDQLIDESNYSWLHISYSANGNRNQILHLS